MKKNVILLFLLLFVSFLSIQAQTYYYKQISLVDNNGVKRQGSERIECITFVNQKGVCYWSDKNGNQLRNQDSFVFRQTVSNGIHIYTSYVLENMQRRASQRSPFSPFLNPNSVNDAYWDSYYGSGGVPTYKFSRNFDRLNISYTKGSVMQKPTEVWVRVSSPAEEFDGTMY